MSLNINELMVLKAIAVNAQDVAGGDFSLTNEIISDEGREAYGIGHLSGSQVKGYVSKLQTKGLIACDSVIIDDHMVYQATLDKRALEVLIENGKMFVIEAEEFECWW